MRVPLSRTLVVVLVLAAGCKKEPKKDPAPESGPSPSNPSGVGTTPSGASGTPSAPAGWQEGQDTVGGYKMLLPGRVQFTADTSNTSNVNQDAKASRLTHAHGNPEKETTVTATSYLLTGPTAGKLGSTPDEYYTTFLADRSVFLTYNEVLVKSVVTLGGRPALKLVVKAKVADTPLPDDPEFLKDELERRRQRNAKRTTYLLTANNNRVVQIQINTLSEPDAAFLKTIIDSFRFL